MNGFDIDGVITVGIRPAPGDVIITGRSYEEAPETLRYLQSIGLGEFPVYFNPSPFADKTREGSGTWKAHMIYMLQVTTFFEDDPVQAKVIEGKAVWSEFPVSVVKVTHDLTEKDNVRHPFP